MTFSDHARSRLQNSLLAQSLLANFAPVAILGCCVFALFAGFFMVQLNAFKDELKVRAVSLAKFLAQQAELPILISDSAELRRVGTRALAVNDVLYVVVERSDGHRLIAVAQPSFEVAAVPSRVGGSAYTQDAIRGRNGSHEYLDVLQPITAGGNQQLIDWEQHRGGIDGPITFVRVGLSTAKAVSLYRKTIWGGVLVSLIALAVILAVQHAKMRRVLSPLKALIEFTRQVAKGDLNQRAPVLRQDEVGQLAVACNEMVHELDKSRGELLAALDASQESSRLKSQFLANMSHEIRTPLNGVIGMTELALDTQLTGEQREYLTTAATSAQSLLTVLNDILDFSKIEAGKLDLDCEPFDLESGVFRAVKTLAGHAHSKGVEVVCDIASDVPCWLQGDADRLRQVLLNLLSNAVKFTEEGQIVVSVSLDSRTDDQVILRFSVADTGIGIPADKQALIFDSFTQADGSTTRKYGGTGLGLAISARLVGMMGGTMGVNSEPGQGSTFHFTAHLALAPEPVVETDEPDAELEAMRALIVDDNLTNLRILEACLRRWGMQVEVALSGKEAIASTRRAQAMGTPFGLLLLDATMPEMNGFDVARQISTCSDLRHPTIMMLSSSDLHANAERCRELGIAKHLIKPVFQGDLRKAIAVALGQQRQGENHEAEREPVQGSGISILLAEDNPVNSKLAERLLTNRGHTVTIAHDGFEALDAAAAHHFDLILMDVQMPGLDGLEATRRLRAREKATRSHIPVIAMTAHAMKGDRERCVLAGMDGYITKPINRAELFRAIAAAVGPGEVSCV